MKGTEVADTKEDSEDGEGRNVQWKDKAAMLPRDWRSAPEVYYPFRLTCHSLGSTRNESSTLSLS